MSWDSQVVEDVSCLVHLALREKDIVKLGNGISKECLSQGQSCNVVGVRDGKCPLTKQLLLCPVCGCLSSPLSIENGHTGQSLWKA
jgi:hypothetical protein